MQRNEALTAVSNWATAPPRPPSLGSQDLHQHLIMVMLCEMLTFVERSDWRSVFLQRLKVLERNTGEGIDTQKSDIKKQNGPVPPKIVSFPGSC